MPTLTPSSVSILPANQQSGGSLKEKAQALGRNSQHSDDASLWAVAGDALSNAQSQIDQIVNALRKPIPTPQVYQITDPSGALVAEIGNLTGTNNKAYPGIWGKNLYVGGTGPDTAPFFANGSEVIIGQNGIVEVLDGSGNIVAEMGAGLVGGGSSGIWGKNIYVGGTGPATAPLFSNGQIVAIGQNGQVFILDPYGAVGAWLGTQSETAKNVTGAITNGSGAIRLTVVAHGWVTGDEINVATVGGVPNATGQWIITVIAANTIDLIGSTFGGTYTSGGTANRFFAGGLFSTIAVGGAQRVTGIANSAGLARVTVTAHGYSTGYAVVLTGTTGVPGINGISWPITVVSANTFDLVGSVFTGTYTGGGLSLNWPTAKLIARDDGSLSINGATINLDGSGATIILDPVVGQITIQSTSGPPYALTTIAGSGIVMNQTGAGANGNAIVLNPGGSMQISGLNGGSTSGVFLAPNGVAQLLTSTTGSYSGSLQVFGYSGTTINGPFLLLEGARGTQGSSSAAQSGDILGGYGACSNISLAVPVQTGAVQFAATQNQSSGHQGTQIQFVVTPNNGSPIAVMVLDQNARLGILNLAPTYPLDVNGQINTSSGFLVGGVPGIDATTAFGISLTVGTGGVGSSLTVNTSATGVFGTPAAGQSNGTVVTGVTLNVGGSAVTSVSLNTAANTFSKGLLTS